MATCLICSIKLQIRLIPFGLLNSVLSLSHADMMTCTRAESHAVGRRVKPPFECSCCIGEAKWRLPDGAGVFTRLRNAKTRAANVS
jgi:hypothetical protein